MDASQFEMSRFITRFVKHTLNPKRSTLKMKQQDAPMLGLRTSSRVEVRVARVMFVGRGGGPYRNLLPGSSVEAGTGSKVVSQHAPAHPCPQTTAEKNPEQRRKREANETPLVLLPSGS